MTKQSEALHNAAHELATAALRKVSAERDRMRAAIEWVLNDAKYKAPEQAYEASEVWLWRLKDCLNNGHESTK